MLTPNKKRNGLMIGLAIAASIGLTACMDKDNKKNQAERGINSAPDSSVSANTEGAAGNAAMSAPVTKKVRKGKTSITWTTTTTYTKVVRDKDGVYSRPATMPMYPGGQDALAKYVEDNINYDQAAVDADASGTVMVSFVVDEKGKVDDAQVIGKGVDANLDREAIRVVEQMPEWTPGTVKGKNVKTRLQLPITFMIVEQ